MERGAARRVERHLEYGHFSYFRFAKFQVEGLKSQNRCLCSLQNALWEVQISQGPGPFSQIKLLKTGRSGYCYSYFFIIIY